MDIIYYHPFFNADEWIAGIRKRLPQANVRAWQEGDNAPAKYALVWKPPYSMLAGRADLRAVFALGAGVDAILDQERQHPGTLPEGVPLIRLQDAGMALQMEEYTTAAVLRYFRRFDDYQQLQQAGKWQYLVPYTHDKFTIGVMGLGVLGRRVAQRLAGLGFTVKGWSNSKKELDSVMTYDHSQLAQFLNETKVIVNLLPNTPKTVGILNKSLFDKLAKGAFIINIARGVHLVEHDFLAALASGQIEAATLDVFSHEPLPEEHPFWQHPKVTITPHISAITYPDVGMDQICEKIKALEQGMAVEGLVDLLKGY